MAKIFIDAGHGGNDPGAIGKRSKEKDNVLKVANRLKVLLEGHGHTVRLSRSTDVFIQLSERARLANAWGADYFVSLHNNAATASTTGFETFIYDGPVQSKAAGFQNAIHTAIIKEIGIQDRGKKRANFAVLRETKMPAVLIEYAFISNTNDENILINEVEKLAQLTVNGIVNYAGSSKSFTPPDKVGDLTLSQYNELKKKIESLESKLDTDRAVSSSFVEDWKWAEGKGLIDGSRPSYPITREQLSAVLHRYDQDNSLTGTAKDDLKVLLKKVFDEGLFSIDHSDKVETMPEHQIINLLISIVSRTFRVTER